jgi:rhodanese-related sulfurtransferase/glyoxylase-like metal-dependent hydrolase (beta-lactamase superfamily II)
MIFTQYYLDCLSHASYLIGDETTGRAVVVDPQRDVSGYLRDAEDHGLEIERVIETHVHADFLSGHLELAARTGAAISYGDAADVDFQIEKLPDGERLSLGEVELEVRATPGHTPESISVVVREHAGDDVPYGVLTGDTLFIGDVGRPDLLASAGLGADELARRLYRSLHDKLLPLPDATRVFPAHGAGSACGKNLSTETQSTIGEQRASNYALAPMSEDEFVALVTEGQPLRPHYFSFDAQRNREAHELLDEQTPPEPIGLEELFTLQYDGAVVLDTREPMDFAAGHLEGAVNVGLQGRFAEFAGDVLAPQRSIVLVGDPGRELEAKVRLGRIGFDGVIGYLAEPVHAFLDCPEAVERSSRLTIEQLAELRGNVPDLQLVDVRNPGETAMGTLPGAVEMPLPTLVDTLDGLDPDRPTVVYCAGGYRSSIAASVLAATGFADTSDVLGGFEAWRAAGLPVATGTTREESMSTSPSDVPEVGPEEGKALVDGGALLLDVREPDEWAAGHAPGASFLPMGQVQANQHELPEDRRIVAICRSGGRSAAVAEALNSRGFDAVNLAGGMRAWQAAGLDVVTDDGAPGAVI